MSRYTTYPMVQALQNETWLYSIVVAIVAVLTAIFVSNMIAWQSGKDRSYIKRRVCFGLIGLTYFVGFFLYNKLVVEPNISQQGWQAMFSKTNLESSLVGLIIYYIVGVVIMSFWRHSKFGSILGKEKEKK